MTLHEHGFRTPNLQTIIISSPILAESVTFSNALIGLAARKPATMARHIDYHSLPTPPKADSEAELINSINKLITAFPPQKAYDRHLCHGLYSGPTSIAYLLQHISILHPNLSISDKSPSSWCRAYLTGQRPTIDVTPTRCGIANETLAHLAVSAAVNSGNDLYAKNFLAHLPSVISDTSTEASNEWLYGRAGTLYFLRLVRQSNSNLHRELNEATIAVIERIISEGPPWYWHGKEYLGAAHGSVGILTQVVLSSPAHILRLSSVLEDLLSQQDPKTGNWPSSPSASSADKLVQFCHGAPGFIISLIAIRPYVAQFASQGAGFLLSQIDATIAKGRECIAKRGLLTKQPSLCHGAVGNALAFDKADKRREMFMRWCQRDIIQQGLREGWYVEADDTNGLYCGEAGRAWGWAIETRDSIETEIGMIGYVDV